jgi:alpha,alpha-trehalose phosphorylase
MRHHISPVGLPAHKYEVDPWRLVEIEFDPEGASVDETLFAIGNGYIGMRANPSEGRESYSHGTYLNGFHETWEIRHAEDAYGFAKTGQTIVNVPDAKLMKLYVDDEPLLLATADIREYRRELDFKNGVSSRDLIWRTPAGKSVRVRTERMVSFEHRHLAVMTIEVTLLDEPAPVVISSQLLNRQDGQDEYHVRLAALGEGMDPRQARKFDRRVLMPRLQRQGRDSEGPVILGFQCASSAMTLACGYQHLVDTASEHTATTEIMPDLAKTVFTIDGQPGQTIRLTKLVSYHSSTGVPCEELADRCSRTLARARTHGVHAIKESQRAWLDDFWARSDITITGNDPDQQAIRWNLFQLAQATARTQEQGVAAKGVTGGGYDGHYFWDTEVYVVPFLAATNPEVARKLLRFRWKMLPAARARAKDLNQSGALYPWRTINGEEASAYYAAGTAQYHINAAVAYALERYMLATGDDEFLATEGAEILVETARLWCDLGFHSTENLNGLTRDVFRIHGVTGPDEYTTVVNDNLYTNVMARFNLRYAADTVNRLKEEDPRAYEALRRRTGLLDSEGDSEVQDWIRAADAMYLPYSPSLGIYPQEDSFLDRERWDFENTPANKYPLLLHFHPLVIYRHQVLKQADVVLAMYLRSDQFDVAEKRRNFDYYDPLTTGDSSLSACVQSIVAAQVGYRDLAWAYFRQSLYLDLNDTHGNTDQGVHIASAAGVWAGVVHGFAGMVDLGDALRFSPQLPDQWLAAKFAIHRRGSVLQVELGPGGAHVTLASGPPTQIETPEGILTLGLGESVQIPPPEL